MDRVMDVNDDITSLESSINVNPISLNEEIEFDKKVKEAVDDKDS
jgi:hypothetical protein